jgi:hypothetical protein
VPSETPTIQPSSTPTATLTLEPTIEATATQPAPPANPEFVEGIGKITSVVQRDSDNKWYGVNELGMAVTVQNEKGEWVPYDRPMKLAQYGGATDPLITLESLGLTEILPEEVTRLKGGKIKSEYTSVINPTDAEFERIYEYYLPFGVVLEEKPYENSTKHPEWKDVTHVYISGINRGTESVKIYDVGLPNNSAKFLILEVPLQFESQILLILLPDQPYINGDIYHIPETNNVQDAKRVAMTDHDLMEDLSADNSIGDQLVLALQINNPPGFSTYSYNNACTQLVRGINTGNAVDIDFGVNAATRTIMPKP